ncbi:PspA/IM30 family protein [Acidiphilium sp. AL]|uniref:PspA/IM30 family protein n=1 Tax=Acidiphilium iwatense TaxID=768198 RepID=A0ABS9DUJ7_9PROT|nr:MULTISPECIES: PspA/IM30 family protein [Acidiphilium]MCF3946408.1 PspA/IM30 family protein [Acidiphilium iwatense]MCU4158584.1 PspA/IM30 family protein [Acidiphilium sp. AL]
MSLMSRFTNLVAAKANKFLDAAEDPDAELELSYEKMLTSLQETKGHLADVIAEQITLEHQITDHKAAIDRHDQDARIALKAGREDLARAALGEKSSEEHKLAPIQTSLDHVRQQADKLKIYEQKLEDKIEQFRTEKESLKAEHQAAEAELQVDQQLAGIGKGLGGVEDTIQHARDKTHATAAKAEAMERMMDEGVIHDPLDHRTGNEHAIEKLRDQSDIDDQLAKLRAELDQNKEPPQP